MTRSNLARNLLIFAASAAWVFLLLALASFSPTDWPSHAVQPYPPVSNLCGSAGAFIAYYLFLFAGQGVFPVLFFTGVCLVLYIFDNPIGDLWMRAAGLALLAVAFAAAVHHFRPGTVNGLPEGQGGVIGIASAHFLQGYFNTVGTRLILATTLLIGLLLAADDLVLRTPGAVTAAYTAVRERTPRINWNVIPIPNLPSLPRFVTRDAVMERMAALTVAAKKKRDGGDEDGEVVEEGGREG
jgi:S-DNA-T family DNA segregation ATPase FtsK/SpoIIIE